MATLILLRGTRRAASRVKEHGYDIGEKKLGCDQTWQVWLNDPNGVRIELQQYTGKSLQFLGGDLHCELVNTRE